MSVFAFVGCLMNFHRPLRRDVEWDGRTYVGVCRHCGTPIERRSRRNWRKRDIEDSEEGKPTSG